MAITAIKHNIASKESMLADRISIQGYVRWVPIVVAADLPTVDDNSSQG